MLGAGLLSGCGASTQSDFSLELYLEAGENTETLEIDDTEVDYTWTYGEGGKESFALTEEEVQSLKWFIKDQILDQNLIERQTTNETGNPVEMTLNVEIDGITNEIIISGMSATDSEGQGGSNLENFSRIEAAQDLIAVVKDLGGLYEKD